MSISNIFLAVALVVVGVVHFVPVSGVFSAERLAALYGVRPDSTDIVLLLRHRALMFALVGGLLLAGAFVPGLRVAAIVGGMVSMVGFMVLYALTANPGPAMQKIFYADVFASALLGVALVSKYAMRA